MLARRSLKSFKPSGMCARWRIWNSASSRWKRRPYESGYFISPPAGVWLMGARGLLLRVRRLEERKQRILRAIGSLEKFEAEIKEGIAAGTYCPMDMPIVMRAVRKWTAMY